MFQKDVSDRQSRILDIIVSSYVDTAMPVGSRLVSKVIGLSSATVRNVMSDLEEFGYITHPHTSAGRIPTDKGYRCYVESLMRVKDITRNEARKIEEEYHKKRQGVEEIIRKTAEVLSGITNHTGIALLPRFKKSAFRHIDLIPIGRRRILIVLITSTGIVKNLIIETDGDYQDDVTKIANLLNSEYYGLSLEDIRERLIREIKSERDSFHSVLRETSEIIESLLEDFYSDELYLDGTSCLLSQPEFEGLKTARSILQVFENKNRLLEAMDEDIGEDGLRIYIGKENRLPNMQNCSMVTTSYRIKDEMIGRLGIIGPTRMAYSHLIPVVEYVSEAATRALNELME